ncbi:lipopolysaccharide transport periplasmic protein LptA [Marinomonas sp. 5E14-1]|uniref:lipopolysaccharide transport periplasmic protein LptA n=1 Tax=Marinomonas sp. 5E14-1 TaxID=3153922 RepID=UPI003263323A
MKHLINICALLISALLSQYTYALPDDINKPIEVQADEVSFNQNTGEAIYKGNVFIKQGSIEIQAQYLKVVTDVKTKKFNRLEALGEPAKFSQQINLTGNTVTSKGNKIHYSITQSKLEIIGNGQLSKLNNSISADYILYTIDDGAFSAEKKGTGRVSMTLQSPLAEETN